MKRLELGSRIPSEVALVSPRTGAPLPWGRPSLGPTVLVVSETGAASYLESIGPARERYEKLGGRILQVSSNPEAPGSGDVRDPGARLRRALDLDDAESAVLIADRWGEIYEILTPRSERPWPDAKELVDWLYFLVTQCPECGVLDDARRDWGNVL